MTPNQISYKIIGCALEVFHSLGPGMLESVYEKALIRELEIQGLHAENQVPISIMYKGVELGDGLRLDLLVEDTVIVELKSVESVLPVHFKQLQTYLRLKNKPLGLLINFNEKDLMDGVHRVINANSNEMG